MDSVYHSHYAPAPKSNKRTYCPNIDTKASNFAIPSAVSNHGIWTPPQSATADRRPSFDASISGLSSSATLSPQPPSTPHNENIVTDDFVLIRPNDSFSESEGLPNLTSNCILQTPMRQSSMYTQAPHTTDERSYQQYIDHGMTHRLHGQVRSEPRSQMHYDHSQWEQFTPTEVFSTPAPMMPTQAIASVGLTPSLFSDYHQVPSSAAASQSSPHGSGNTVRVFPQPRTFASSAPRRSRPTIMELLRLRPELRHLA
ncbi:hypothetical protein M8818_007470 [Zalaria obscura]|uniref:Uncharacterized protein n=1 Tax=Zalaria obscura TaxID=2024903 RepID=A0ACC3S428_9PEZI